MNDIDATGAGVRVALVRVPALQEKASVKKEQEGQEKSQEGRETSQEGRRSSAGSVADLYTGPSLCRQHASGSGDVPGSQADPKARSLHLGAGIPDFGKIVQKTAKATGVGFVADAEAGLRPKIREIVFGDTPDFRLYNSAFILRRRVAYVDGFPVGDPEIVFKFRHPDENQATAIDVRPKIAGKYRIKFKAEALPLKGVQSKDMLAKINAGALAGYVAQRTQSSLNSPIFLEHITRQGNVRVHDEM